MKFNDALVGFVVALLGAAMISQALYFPKAQHIPYGPGFLPTLLGIGLMVCGTILIVTGLAARRREPLLVLGEWSKSPYHIFGFILVLACLGFYVILADDLGHLVCSILILFALISYLTRKWRSALVIAVLASIALQIFFVDLLLVPLPWGLLEPYSGLLTWR